VNAIKVLDEGQKDLLWTVSDRRPESYFLDVDGGGRLVLILEQAKCLGITVLPRIRCHPMKGSA
jgi:hypothetical protein